MIISWYLKRIRFEISCFPKQHRCLIGAFILILPVPFLISSAKTDQAVFMLGMMALSGLTLVCLAVYYIVDDFVKWVKSGR